MEGGSGRAVVSAADDVIGARAVAIITYRIVAALFISVDPTSGVRGPDTLWRVPWTPLLGFSFLLVHLLQSIPDIEQFRQCISEYR